MVIADKNVSFHDLSVPVLVYTSSNDPKGQVVSWQHSYTFRPGRWAQTDFDFEVPTKSLLTSETTVLKLANAEQFRTLRLSRSICRQRYGREFDTNTDGGRGSSVSYCCGEGHAIRLDVGAKFKLQDHPCQDPKEPYVISQVHHEASDPTYFGNSQRNSELSNTFEAIPYDVQFRPLRVTERPFVHGPQTAIVVGPPGEKIFTDKHGRVRVQFHWDRYGKHDDKSSCWIRCRIRGAVAAGARSTCRMSGTRSWCHSWKAIPTVRWSPAASTTARTCTAMGMPDNKTQSAMRDHSRQRDRHGGQRRDPRTSASTPPRTPMSP